MLPQSSKTPTNCLHCGKEFLSPNRRPRKYCCRTCYLQAHANPDPFFPNIEEVDGHWAWTGRRDKDGYGLISNLTTKRRAHRYSWVLHYGPIPEGMNVLHKCDRPWCVNPEHLFLGTTLDNNRDCHAKGRAPVGDNHPSRKHPERLARGERSGQRTHPERTARGERQGQAKLTDDKVRQIRVLLTEGKMSVCAIARTFEVSQATIYFIREGRSWKHVA